MNAASNGITVSRKYSLASLDHGELPGDEVAGLPILAGRGRLRTTSPLDCCLGRPLCVPLALPFVSDQAGSSLDSPCPLTPLIVVLEGSLTCPLGLPPKLSFGGIGFRRPEAGVSEAPFSLAPLAGFPLSLLGGDGVDGTEDIASYEMPLVVETGPCNVPLEMPLVTLFELTTDLVKP